MHEQFTESYTLSTHRYVRLDAMEGVVAYHSGDREAAARHLAAAQGRWQKLQVGRGGRLQGCCLRQTAAFSYQTSPETCRAKVATYLSHPAWFS